MPARALHGPGLLMGEAGSPWKCMFMSTEGGQPLTGQQVAPAREALSTYISGSWEIQEWRWVLTPTVCESLCLTFDTHPFDTPKQHTPFFFTSLFCFCNSSYHLSSSGHQAAYLFVYYLTSWLVEDCERTGGWSVLFTIVSQHLDQCLAFGRFLMRICQVNASLQSLHPLGPTLCLACPQALNECWTHDFSSCPFFPSQREIKEAETIYH